jgi:hypothetical protein
MRHRAALTVLCVTAFSGFVGAQGQEFAHLLRNGEQAMLTVFGSRPVDLVVNTLVKEFGVAVNVEGPLYFYRDDVQLSYVAASGKRVMVPRASLLEMPVALNHDGSMRDLGQTLEQLRDAVNRQSPFAYRIEQDGDVFTLVATRTRDVQGQSFDLTPLLDRHVTIPPGRRKIFEHVNLLTESLREQTGVLVSCCQSAVGGLPWGSTLVSFEARDEPARSVFLRLLRSEPGRDRLVKEGGAYLLLKSKPGREHWHWTMACQPGEALCVINVAAIPE